MAHAVHGHGAPAIRVEHERLVTGRGRYASDWNLPGQLYAHFVRADRAHAEIIAINADAAELKVDPAELRRRNFILPQAFSYKCRGPGAWRGGAGRASDTQRGGRLRPRHRQASHRQLHGLLHAARKDDPAHPDGGQSDSSHQQAQ